MDLAANLESIRADIEAACGRAKRDPASVLLLPVSKGHPPDAIAAVAALGVDRFGENKVQEARAKIPLCPGRLRWDMIGHLQSNKCRDAVHFFERIQSVDSIAIASELNKCAEKAGRKVPVFLQVNLGGESSKFGFLPERVAEEMQAINQFPRLIVDGLMAIPPWSPDPEKTRPLFRRLREIKEGCEAVLGVPLNHLSMGMSGDFSVAIEEGATLVRVGTRLFGPRTGAGFRSRIGGSDGGDGP